MIKCMEHRAIRYETKSAGVSGISGNKLAESKGHTFFSYSLHFAYCHPHLHLRYFGILAEWSATMSTSRSVEVSAALRFAFPTHSFVRSDPRAVFRLAPLILCNSSTTAESKYPLRYDLLFAFCILHICLRRLLSCSKRMSEASRSTAFAFSLLQP
jgi:hypothetical protein